jgi:hypothetical protein
MVSGENRGRARGGIISGSGTGAWEPAAGEIDAMNKQAIRCLREITPCLVLLILLPALGLAGCKAQAPPLSPGAAAFKKDVRDILARLTPALAGPLAQNDAKAAEQVMLSLYPTAGQEQAGFPFWLGALSKEGVLLAALPPAPAIGDDFIKYQGVQEILAKRRINKKRLYAPDGAPIYLILAPVMVQDNIVGLVGLRVTAVQALKKWGITEKEFQAMDLN